jgi:hypothetical protein
MGDGPGRITAAAWQWHGGGLAGAQRTADGDLGKGCRRTSRKVQRVCRLPERTTAVARALHMNLILARDTETNYLRMNVPDTSTFSWDTEKIADMSIKIRVKTS